MKNQENELETTKEIETLSAINNQIYEVEEKPVVDEEKTIEEKPTDFFTTPKKPKKIEKLKNWWKKRNKKQKILIITGAVLFLIILIVSIVLLVLSSKKEENIPVPDVIVQEENYRYENGVLIFLNSNQEEIGRYTCENQNEELCFVSYYSTEDQFDVEKKVDESNQVIATRSSILDNTYVFINDNPRSTDEEIKLYDMKNNETKETYTLIKKGNNNQYIFKNENHQYGLMEEKDGTWTVKIEATYDYLGFVSNSKNYYIARLNGVEMLISDSGKTISKSITGDIKNLNETYVKVLNGEGKYEVRNFNNQNVFGSSYDYVELRSDYAILITNDQMFLKFYDKNKLNEEGIPLFNKDYVKTSVYDENNQLKETKECFGIEENNDIITLSIHNNEEIITSTINKKEGSISKTLRNMSYFDGKLYFYSDLDKTSLLGSYTCSNKNNMEESSLKNCTLAVDTIFENNDYEIAKPTGVIPIFNERFVFITDNPDLVNDTTKTIVLYDLKKNSSLGKYRNVNTYSYTGTSEITFTTVTDLQVVAQNQNGNFGVIKINLTDVTGHIGFNYSEMEKLRDYYVAKDGNGYLLIARKDGASVTSALPYKIRNYNNQYVKVNNNGNYYIYDYKGLQKTTTGFKYIELYDQFFAGVNENNQLGVYTYDHPTQNIISGGELISLHRTNYYGNGILAFKISGTEILVGNDTSYTPVAQNIVLPTEN